MTKSSEFSGLYKLPIEERVKLIKRFARLTDDEASLLQRPSALNLEVANRMVENLVGIMPIPIRSRGQLHHKRQRDGCPDGDRRTICYCGCEQRCQDG